MIIHQGGTAGVSAAYIDGSIRRDKVLGNHRHDRAYTVHRRAQV